MKQYNYGYGNQSEYFLCADEFVNNYLTYSRIAEIISNDQRSPGEDDMVVIPQQVFDEEENITEPYVNIRQAMNDTGTPCMSIKIVYNKGWLQSAGNGNIERAQQRVYEVLAEAQKIYGSKFSPRNRLRINVTFQMIEGNIALKPI